jgi:Tol biopolymer transport system component/DNA-binding winged helix-turn-helix (wHTH) protein
MHDQALTPGWIRFGPFELEPRSGQLCNGDSRQNLADQPLALLKALAARPGELVTREELRQLLWPDGTFVGFDHGLNSAINRLREALNDSAETPRFIETIPRRGYRLLVPVEVMRPTVPRAVEGASATPTSEAPGTAGIDLDRAGDSPPTLAHEASGTRKLTRGFVLRVAATIGALSVAGLLWRERTATPEPLLANVAIDLPAGWLFHKNLSPAISPDSQYIVMSASHSSGRFAIWLRPLGGTTWRVLSHTENGSAPFWSPDGHAVGFFADGKLKVLSLAEGSVRIVCDAPSGNGSWFSSNAVLIAPARSGGVAEVNVESGELRDVTSPDRDAGDISHGSPMLLPGGRHFVYVTKRMDGSVGMLASLDAPGSVSLGPVQSHVQPVASDRVLFVRDGALLAQRLDVTSGKLTGDPKILAEGLTAAGWQQGGRFSASAGMVVYQETVNPFPVSELRIFDRTGMQIGTVGEATQYSAPSISPDGARLAVAISQTSSPARDIWVFDLVGGKRTRVTSDLHDDVAPQWSADGKWLMFTSDRRGERNLYKRLASGEGSDELVFESSAPKSLNDWTPDGRFVVYDTGAYNGIVLPDLHVLQVAGGSRDVVLSAEAGAQHQADISADSRFVAYASSASGRYEVVVETFPDKRGRWPITVDGGQNPSWRGDGRELYYTKDDTVLAIDVDTDGDGFEWRPARSLFKIPNLTSAPVRSLAVSGNGQRFIAVVPVSSAPQQRLTTVLNWTTLLK